MMHQVRPKYFRPKPHSLRSDAHTNANSVLLNSPSDPMGMDFVGGNFADGLSCYQIPLMFVVDSGEIRRIWNQTQT